MKKCNPENIDAKIYHHFNDDRLNEGENTIINVLFQVDFPGKHNIIEDMKNSSFERIGDSGSLEISFFTGREKIGNGFNQPVYIEAYQQNSAPVCAQLLVRNDLICVFVFTVDGRDLVIHNSDFDNVGYYLDHVEKDALNCIKNKALICDPSLQNPRLFDNCTLNEYLNKVEQKLQFVTGIAEIRRKINIDTASVLYIVNFAQDRGYSYYMRIFCSFNSRFSYLDVVNIPTDNDSQSIFNEADLEACSTTLSYPNGRIVGKARKALYDIGFKELSFSFLIKRSSDCGICFSGSCDPKIFELIFGVSLYE